MASPALPVVPGRPSAGWWRLAQWAGVAALAATTVALWTYPHRATVLFWRGVLPLVPILFLIHPAIWRNVCPLGTLSMGPDRPGSAALGSGSRAAAGPPRRQDSPSLWRSALVLLVLIAARPLGLDESGPASATLLVGLGSAAILGRRRVRKSGFCNRHCPVLAVEQLYGQSPLVRVPNVRCDGCSACTSRGCLDLSATAASAQLMGPDRHGGGWLRTPLGAFAALFPGVIVGFHTLPPDPDLLRVALGLGVGALVSGLLTVLAVEGAGLGWRLGLRGLGGVSAALYLGFALPDVAAVWGWPMAGGPLRILGLALVLTWFVHGLGPRRQRR